jgi:hypothetical protein
MRGMGEVRDHPTLEADLAALVSAL